MPFATTDGDAAEMSARIPTESKPRGRSLTDARVRKLRDVLLIMLVRIVRLSVPDAVAVLTAAKITRRHAYRILDRRSMSLADVLKTMQACGAGDKHER